MPSGWGRHLPLPLLQVTLGSTTSLFSAGSGRAQRCSRALLSPGSCGAAFSWPFSREGTDLLGPTQAPPRVSRKGGLCVQLANKRAQDSSVTARGLRRRGEGGPLAPPPGRQMNVGRASSRAPPCWALERRGKVQRACPGLRHAQEHARGRRKPHSAFSFFQL